MESIVKDVFSECARWKNEDSEYFAPVIRKTSSEDLQEHIRTLLQEKDNLQEKIIQLKKSVLTLQKDIEKQSHICENLTENEKQLQKTRIGLKHKLNLLKEGPLTEGDQEKLKKSQKKLVLYELCTGVIFDYSCGDSIKGFVENRCTKDLKYFSFEKNCNVEEALWQAISSAGAVDTLQHIECSLSTFQQLSLV